MSLTNQIYHIRPMRLGNKWDWTIPFEEVQFNHAAQFLLRKYSCVANDRMLWGCDAQFGMQKNFATPSQIYENVDPALCTIVSLMPVLKSPIFKCSPNLSNGIISCMWTKKVFVYDNILTALLCCIYEYVALSDISAKFDLKTGDNQSL